MQNIEKSQDGTIKIIFKGGYHCVLVPQKSGFTLCVSSQVGCAMGCTFCQTAKMGFKKNLSKKQIVEQFEESLKYLNIDFQNHIWTNENNKNEDYAQNHIKAIVYMGMGEPLNNYNNVIDSIEYLNKIYAFPFKKVTISTSGIIPNMKKLNEYPNKIQFALSLHSAIQEKRDILMPYLKQFPIKDLIEVSNNYSKTRKDKIMIEYIMIKDLNDTDEDLKALINLGFDKMTNFNLIPLNGSMTIENKEYQPSTNKRCLEFKEELINQDYKCFIRHNMGNDIEAACGMLNHKE